MIDYSTRYDPLVLWGCAIFFLGLVTFIVTLVMGKNLLHTRQGERIMAWSGMVVHYLSIAPVAYLFGRDTNILLYFAVFGISYAFVYYSSEAIIYEKYTQKEN